MPHHWQSAQPSKIFLRASRPDWSGGRFRLTPAMSSQNLFVERSNEFPPVIFHRTGPRDFSHDCLKTRALHHNAAVAFGKKLFENAVCH
jgi:hypothetical protein